MLKVAIKRMFLIIVILLMPVAFLSHFGNMPIIIASLYSLGDYCVYDLCFKPNIFNGPVKLREDCIFFSRSGDPSCITVNNEIKSNIVEKTEYVKKLQRGEMEYHVYKGLGTPSLDVPQVIYLVPRCSDSVLSMTSDKVEEIDVGNILSGIYLMDSSCHN